MLERVKLTSQIICVKLCKYQLIDVFMTYFQKPNVSQEEFPHLGLDPLVQIYDQSC